MRWEPESIGRLRRLHRDLVDEIDRARAEKLGVETRLAGAETTLEQMFTSRSWRWTAPLRWITRTLGGIPPAENSWPSTSREAGAASLAPDTSRGLNRDEMNNAFDEAAKALYRQSMEHECRRDLESFLASDRVLSFDPATEPEVSVLLVLFNRAELTLGCLRSLLENRKTSFEVVIVDNCSTDVTDRLLERIEGAHVIRNTSNRHFLEGINQAAGAARGRNLLVLNNDTRLLPGAIEAATDTLESAADIGAVGGKLVLPDGSLQEAGSIVWRDGSCLGYGRGDDPLAPPYMFRRDVDYCSAAFLLTPRELFERLGGFDTAFAPAYYEETDYCMRLWNQGFRVVYEPFAATIHVEFASSRRTEDAIDLQRAHRKVFVDRHADALEHHQSPDRAAVLLARYASRTSHTNCLVVDECPRGADLDPAGLGLLRDLVREGSRVTLYPTGPAREWADLYRHIPREVEIMRGAGAEGLEDFFHQRSGYYDTIFVGPGDRKRVDAVAESHPGWFEETAIVDATTHASP